MASHDDSVLRVLVLVLVLSWHISHWEDGTGLQFIKFTLSVAIVDLCDDDNEEEKEEEDKIGDLLLLVPIGGLEEE